MARTPMRCMQLTAFGEPLSEHAGFAPEPTGTEIVLRVRGAGVCHSDVHLWEGFHDYGHGRRASFQSRIQLPLTLGHETAGEAFSAGPDAKGVTLGANYLLCSWIGCGTCPACRAEDEHLCTAPHYRGVNRDGGYADFVLVPHPRYLVALGDLDPVASAPLACSGLTAFGAIRKVRRVTSSQPIVIIGAGGLGLMAIGLLGLMGGPAPIAVDIDPRKRAAALEAGAASAIDPAAPDAQGQIRAAVGGPVPGVIDFVGSESTTTLGFELLAKGGMLVVVGLFGGALSIPIPMLASKAATIQGSYIGPLSELRELVSLVRERQLPQTPITRRPLTEAADALALLRQGGVVGRTILVP